MRKCEWRIVHFGSGFDFLPILEWLYEQQQCIPKIVSRGNKVMYVKVGNRRFIDSFLFIAIALRKFSKLFGLTEIKKGYLAHYLTCRTTLDQQKNNVFHESKDCHLGQSFGLQPSWYSEDCDHCNQPTSLMEANIVLQYDQKSHPVFPSTSQQFAFEDGQFPPKCLFR